ncbi:hypothetical protein PV326_012489, partial [Microctonus aethiopoides]
LKDLNMDELPIPLTLEEVQLLKTFPPHELRWSDIIGKHFGEQPPANIISFLKDVVNYQNNVLLILHLRDRETIENLREVCSTCLYTYDGLDNTISFLNDVVNCQNKVLRILYEGKPREYLGKMYSKFLHTQDGLSMMFELFHIIHQTIQEMMLRHTWEYPIKPRMLSVKHPKKANCLWLDPIIIQDLMEEIIATSIKIYRLSKANKSDLYLKSS